MKMFLVLKLHSFEQTLKLVISGSGEKPIKVMDGPRYYLPVFDNYREALEAAGDPDLVRPVELIEGDS